MLKFTRNSVIAFDFHEALSFEGETGPYVQYAAVRGANILKKFADRGDTLPAFDKFSIANASPAIWKRKISGSCCCSPRKQAAPSNAPLHRASPRTLPNTPFSSHKALTTSITNIPSSPKKTPTAAPCFFGSPPMFVRSYSKRWLFWAFNSPLTCERIN
jgi:hypothetical protein